MSDSSFSFSMLLVTRHMKHVHSSHVPWGPSQQWRCCQRTAGSAGRTGLGCGWPALGGSAPTWRSQNICTSEHTQLYAAILSPVRLQNTEWL